MKTRAKKILAALLCFVMAAAVIPANAQPASAAGDGETYSVSYDFKRLTYDDYAEAVKTYDGGNWKWHSAYGSLKLQGYDTSSVAGEYMGLLDSGKAAGSWAALELEGLREGTYTASFGASKGISGTVFDFYLVPANVADVDAACTEDTFIGEIDYYDPSSEMLTKSDVFQNITIPATGNYLLVIQTTGKVHEDYLYWWGSYSGFLSTLTFEGTAVRDIPDMDGEAYSVKYDILNDATNSGWNINSGFDPGTNWKVLPVLNYVDHTQGFTMWHNTGVITLQDCTKAAGSYIAFELKSLKEGMYNVKLENQKIMSGGIFDFYLIPADTADVNAACTEDTFIGEVDYYDFSGAFVKRTDIFEDIVVEKDGSYLLVIQTTGKTNSAHLNWWAYYSAHIDAITFDGIAGNIPTEFADSDIFGKTYAYVKDGDLYFIGGLKVIENYTEVGFEVAVDGADKADIKTDKVYTSFTVAGKTHTAENEFGAEYIFITKLENVGDAESVTIKPYIANGTDKTYHGEEGSEIELTLDLSKLS